MFEDRLGVAGLVDPSLAGAIRQFDPENGNC